MSLLDVVTIVYAATFVAVLFIEITGSAKWARRSAQLAILLAMVAGSTWAYAAHLNRGPLDEDGWRMPPRHAAAARDPEDDDSDLGPGDGRDREVRDGGRGGRGTSSGAVTVKEIASQRPAHWRCNRDSVRCTVPPSFWV